MAIKYASGADSVGAVDHPGILKAGGHATGIYKFNTPDGGVQDGYFLNCSGSSQGGDFGWVLVARFQGGNNTNEPNNDQLAASLRANIDSVRGLDDVSIGGTSYWSADWGTFRPNEIRVMSYNDPDDILNNRGVDWIYKTGHYQERGNTLWEILTNLRGEDQNFYSLTEMENVGFSNNGSKGGMRFQSARDGRGRWTNSSYQFHRVSDWAGGAYRCQPYGFVQPVTGMWHPHESNSDAKWSVSATDSESGQDTDSSALVGYDDTNYAHYDANSGNVNENSTRRDFGNTYCLTIWMR